MDPVHLTLIYDGNGPLNWGSKPGNFGMQDKASWYCWNHSRTGRPAAAFCTSPGQKTAGGLPQRLKLPLGGIAWDDIRASAEQQKPLVGVLIDHHPRVTSTGASIGGSRPMSWQVLCKSIT